MASLEPVPIGGVIVKSASLHNMDEIARKDIRIGDTIVVERAGDVIPYVVKVIEEKRSGAEKHFIMPERCPVCGAEVFREDRRSRLPLRRHLLRRQIEREFEILRLPRRHGY